MYWSRRFFSVYLIQTLYMFPVVFSWSFVYFHLVGAGFSILDMAGFKLTSYASAVALLAAMRRLTPMKSMAAGFFGFAAELILLPFIRSPQTLLLLGVVDGLTFPLFWVPYNTSYFSMHSGGGGAFHAGIVFLAPPVLGIVAPIISGYILDVWGIVPVFLTGAAVLAASGLYYWFGDGESLTFDIRRAWSVGKGIKSLLFIQGFWQGIDWMVVPIYTLFFLKSGLLYGGFFSYIAFFGAASTLYFCRLSDRSGNRVNYLYPSIAMTAAGTFFSAYTTILVDWLLARAVVGFFAAVANPFTTSIVLDCVKNTSDAMHLREVMLNMGRTAGVMSAVICHIYFGGIQAAFIPAGLLLLTYPLIVEYKKLYRGVKPHAIASDDTMGFHD